MIDTPEPPVRFAETTGGGTSKYLPLAMYLLAMSGAEAVAVVVIGGHLGNGGTGAALNVDALAQLPAVLRAVADVQEREAAAWRGKYPPKPDDDATPDDVPR